MDWLRRIGRAPGPAAPGPEDALPAAIEGASPGVAALFDGLSADGTHSILDLGPAAESKLRVYSPFARRMRFTDLLAAAMSPSGWTAALGALPPQPERPYDLVFAWDILDRLPPEGRPRLMERLVELSAANARLHLMVEASEGATTHPFRFTPLDIGRMRYEPSGPARPARPRLQSAEVERVLAPFHVVQAFTLKVGLREYVAMRQGG
jgi:hypothetical protein